MNCPNCGGSTTNWSTPGLGVFGNACMTCLLFVWDEHPGSEPHDIHSRPLLEMPAPPGQTMPIPVGLLMPEARLREIIREEVRGELDTAADNIVSAITERY